VSCTTFTVHYQRLLTLTTYRIFATTVLLSEESLWHRAFRERGGGGGGGGELVQIVPKMETLRQGYLVDCQFIVAPGQSNVTKRLLRTQLGIAATHEAGLPKAFKALRKQRMEVITLPPQQADQATQHWPGRRTGIRLTLDMILRSWDATLRLRHTVPDRLVCSSCK
jgi:hypothetical protein